MKAIEELNLNHALSTGSFAVVYACDIGVYKHYKDNDESNEAMDARRFIPLELSILRSLQHVPFFVQLDDIIHHKDVVTGATMVRYKQNLNTYIKNMQHKNYAKSQKIMYQLLTAVNMLHSINVLHGDIKPGNILIDHNNNAVLCDFNSCHMLSPVNKKSANNRYTYTLWYRPPEIFLRKKITLEADIWSLGIVFSELLLGHTGMLATMQEIEDNYASHHTIFMRQLKTFGTPHEYHSVYPAYKPRYELFFEKLGITKQPKLCNVIRSMLQIMPHQRYNPKQLLTCDYFETIPKIIIEKTPQMVIDEANVLNGTPYKSYYEEINNLKNNIQATLKESYKYCSPSTLQYEALNFAHYIFVLTSNNQDHSIKFQLAVCLVIAVKILDPSNYFIDETMYPKAQEYEQTLLAAMDYKIHFQNTVYYKLTTNSPLSKNLNELLYASLFMSYPEEFTTTDEVANRLTDYSQGKNTNEKYYKDLQKILTKNESQVKTINNEPNK